MSGDEQGGPYHRDKQGFRRRPKEELDRAPHWWEVAGLLVFKYGWLLLVGAMLMWFLRR